MINICYCGNERIFEGLLFSLTSVCLSTKEPKTFYLLTADITYIKDKYRPINEKMRSFLDKTAKKYHPENRVVLVNATKTFRDSFLNSPNLHSMYTPYALLRLVLDKIPNMPERLLYLDCDTVALKDLQELYETPLLGKCFAIVQDYGLRKKKEYGNTGVLLLDLTAIKNNGGFASTRELIIKKKMMRPDQDALNKLFASQMLFLPFKYNEQNSIKEETVIRHYCQQYFWLPVYHLITAKPWQEKKFKHDYPHDNLTLIKDSFLPSLHAYADLSK
jgi:lipopolysaccharide biosynthesis glycosyltransferase